MLQASRKGDHLMKRIHLTLAMMAMTLFVTSSFALQGRGQAKQGAGAGGPRISTSPGRAPSVSASPIGNPGGGNPGGGNPGGGNPGGGNPGGGNPGGGNPGGGNPGGGNPGGGNPGGGNPGGRNPGGGNPGGGNPGGGNPGGGNPGSGNPGRGNPGGGNPGGGNGGRGNAGPRDAMGFKNYGQYVAAQNISQNLGIPFADLKAKMTGANAVSLGRAIRDLRPDLPANVVSGQVKNAEKAAKNEGKHN
jgi:PPE-repeat protein